MVTPNPIVLIVRVFLSYLLYRISVTVLEKDQCPFTKALTFISVLACFYTAGAIFIAGPAAIFLLLYFLWVRFVAYADGGAKRILFNITLVLSGLYAVTQVLHLPIRIALHQPRTAIEANVAGMCLALTMLCAAMELLNARQKAKAEELVSQASGQAPSAPVEFEPVEDGR